MLRKLTIVVLISFGIFFLTVPSENSYFGRLAKDYGQIHSGYTMSGSELKEIGKFNYRNYLFFSSFDYSFGSIGVEYYGFLGFIYFSKSYPVSPAENAQPKMAYILPISNKTDA